MSRAMGEREVTGAMKTQAQRYRQNGRVDRLDSRHVVANVQAGIRPPMIERHQGAVSWRIGTGRMA